jgi:hypothetical protein
MEIYEAAGVTVNVATTLVLGEKITSVQLNLAGSTSQCVETSPNPPQTTPSFIQVGHPVYQRGILSCTENRPGQRKIQLYLTHRGEYVIELWKAGALSIKFRAENALLFEVNHQTRFVSSNPQVLLLSKPELRESRVVIHREPKNMNAERLNTIHIESDDFTCIPLVIPQ